MAVNRNNLKVVYKSVEELIPYVNNARTHSDEQVTQIASSIKEFGFNNPILTDGENGVIAGHGRLLAAKKLKLDKVPTIELSGLTESQKKAYILADNKIALNSGWDEELLKVELEELKISDIDLDIVGFSNEDLQQLLSVATIEEDVSKNKGGEEKSYKTLRELFLVPPVSIIDTAKGEWQERKRAWKELGLDRSEGREDIHVISCQPKSVYDQKAREEEKLGRKLTMNEYLELYQERYKEDGVSIFDPVLCEIMYSWYSPIGAKILDPFAGSAVRGLVANFLKRDYVGIDLRLDQIEANLKVKENFPLSKDNFITWINGDSCNLSKLIKDYKADFVFSCPPYFNLEKYSDSPEDLSNMDYEGFLDSYRKIIKQCYDALNDDRFAVFVVSEVRDKKGIYVNLVGETVKAFESAGFKFYNEQILINPFSSVVMRCKKFFDTSRKLGRTHQNVLTFVKGDPKKATEFCGNVKILEIVENENKT